jgi:GNAT superfamily N-acetyltransferase
MVQLTTRERVDAFWSATLGVAVADLHRAGVRVYPNPPDRATWRGVYVLVFDDAACVFAPHDLLDEARAGVADCGADEVLEPKTWTAILGDRVQAAFGPVLHHYLDSSDGLDEIAVGRRINPRDFEALEGLRAAVAPDEWMMAGFTAQPAMLFGIFDGDRMVAAANLTSGPDAATDVGIVIHPDERGNGYGPKMAATAARQALIMHGVARLRMLAASTNALTVIHKLGAAEYGRNLAAYLNV